MDAEAYTSTNGRLLRYCLELAYDGTGFFGWQSQPHGNTVQDCLEKTLAEVCPNAGRLVPASRTDSGVHALSQFAMFGVPTPIGDVSRLLQSLRAKVDTRILVKGCQLVSQSFHPSVDAFSKLYRYSLWTNDAPDGVRSPTAWRIYGPLDVASIRDDLHAIVGTHDFSAFCAGDCDAPTRVRTILDAWVTRDRDRVHLWFHGRGFLKQMVRILVGTMVERARSSGLKQPLSVLIEGGDRRAAARTAPAQGLTLCKITYR